MNKRIQIGLISILIILAINVSFPLANASSDILTLDDKLKTLDTLTDVSNPVLIKILKENWCYKIGIGGAGQKYVFMASLISNNDILFLATLQGENGEFSPNRIHSDGHGRSFCGIDDRYHPDIVNDTRFSDPIFQMKTCYDMYQSGVKMYAKAFARYNSKYFICPRIEGV